MRAFILWFFILAILLVFHLKQVESSVCDDITLDFGDPQHALISAVTDINCKVQLVIDKISEQNILLDRLINIMTNFALRNNPVMQGRTAGHAMDPRIKSDLEHNHPAHTLIELEPVMHLPVSESRIPDVSRKKGDLKI